MASIDSTAIVQTRNLHKIFQMGKQKVAALAGVDVDIPADSFTVIMGPSGSIQTVLNN